MAFVNETLDFWGVGISTGCGKSDHWCLALECSRCKEVVELVNGDFEYDICAIHGGTGAVLQRVRVVNGRQSTELAPRRGPRVTSAGKSVEAGEDPFAMLEKQSRVAVKVAALEERPAAAARRSDMVMPLAESVDRRARMRAKVNFFRVCERKSLGKT